VIKGFADLHNHQFANFGFGGMAFWGNAYGPIAGALPWCTPVHGPGGVGDIIGGVMKSTYDKSFPIGHLVGGYPQFDGWPRWNSVSHQSVYEDWLRRAMDGGLRLMVMLAVNSERLCGLANRIPGRSCNDMVAVDLQLKAARGMEAYIDSRSGGKGRGWYRIVRSPDEATTAIAAGKLAVVLGIEVDSLFNCRAESNVAPDQLRRELDKYYQLGVRHLFPIHFADNGFGGASFDKVLNKDLDGPLADLITLEPYPMHTEDGTAFGYKYRSGRRNALGLTDLGKTLIREMITRGMIIDVDHMSAKSKSDTFEICEVAKYPVVSGHTGFVEISRGDKAHEGQLLASEVERIRVLGGMVSVIVRQGNLDEITTCRAPGQATIAHTSGNTSNTLVQAYLYAISKMKGAPVALGTDFNGFAGLPGPRFGPDAAPGGSTGPKPVTRLKYPFKTAATGQSMAHSIVGNKKFDFNDDGLAHVGMLPDLIADLEVMGLGPKELSPLLSSADGYVEVWKRAWAHRPAIRVP
jgi:microsomal dipeptidase-like Zn-dependent dipeptidase